MNKPRSGKARSGGGITSNQLRRVCVKAGPPHTNKVSVAATDALGQQLAYKRPDLIKGTMPKVPMGNAVAAQTVCGPGGSRTIYKSGYQSSTGPVSQGEGDGYTSTADRGNRAILGPAPKDKTV
jgi:hypothetical protein